MDKILATRICKVCKIKKPDTQEFWYETRPTCKKCRSQAKKLSDATRTLDWPVYEGDPPFKHCKSCKRNKPHTKDHWYDPNYASCKECRIRSSTKSHKKTDAPVSDDAKDGRIKILQDRYLTRLKQFHILLSNGKIIEKQI